MLKAALPSLFGITLDEKRQSKLHQLRLWKWEDPNQIVLRSTLCISRAKFNFDLYFLLSV
jgi:hypothetical protein